MGIVASLMLFALLGCKDRGKDDQESYTLALGRWEKVMVAHFPDEEEVDFAKARFCSAVPEMQGGGFIQLEVLGIDADNIRPQVEGKYSRRFFAGKSPVGYPSLSLNFSGEREDIPLESEIVVLSENDYGTDSEPWNHGERCGYIFLPEGVIYWAERW